MVLVGELAYADLAGTRYRLRGLYNNKIFITYDETTEQATVTIFIGKWY